MDVTTEQSDGVTFVTLAAESLDASNVPEFKRAFAPAVAANAKVVLDLDKVQFVDSSGCGAILGLLRQLSQVGGDLKLCGVTRPVRSLFELVRMHKILDICNTRDDAVKAFQRG